MKNFFLSLAILPFFLFSSAQNKDKGNVQKSTTPTNAEDKLGTEQYVEICTAIYQGATIGYKGKKLKVYANNSFTEIISAEEILKKGGRIEVISMDDPNNKDLVIDTVIMTPFTPDQTAGIRVVQNITKSDNIFKYTAEITGISLSYYDMDGNKYLGIKDLFFVTFTDLKTFLDEKTYKEIVNACSP